MTEAATYNKFWIVCKIHTEKEYRREEFQKHYTETAAIKEAQRLAKANIGSLFAVMESTVAFKAEAVISAASAVEKYDAKSSEPRNIPKARRLANQQAAKKQLAERRKRTQELAVFRTQQSESVRIETQHPEHRLTNWQRQQWVKDGMPMLDDNAFEKYYNMRKGEFNEVTD
jgi:hypothetical protein